MTTALTLLLVFIGAVAVYLLWAVEAAANGVATGWLLVGAAVIYIGSYLAVGALAFALAWVFRTPRPPGCTIGAAASVRLYFGELMAMAKSHPRMALGWWSMRDPPARPAPAPVLLLHGVLCNAGVWRSALPRIAAAGPSPIYTLTYGPPQASIEHFAEQLAAKIDAIRSATGAAKVTLVAHSMGGLVARAYLRRFGAERVRCLVALGTPHCGSVHARLFPGTCLAQMRPGSAWLAELNRDERALSSTRIVSLWSWHDSMVAPQASARLAGAEDVAVIGVGHNALLEDPGVIAQVVLEIGRAEREAQADSGGA